MVWEGRPARGVPIPIAMHFYQHSGLLRASTHEDLPLIGSILSPSPVIRSSVQVHRCLNDDLAGINSIQKGIGETADKTSPYVGFECRPSFRVLSNVSNGRIDFVEKVAAKTCRLKFLVLSCVQQFQFSRSQKVNWLYMIAALVSHSTAFADREDICPFLYSR